MAFLGNIGGIMGKIKLIRHFFSYLKGYRKTITILLVLSLLSALATIPVPAIYAYLIDTVIPGSNPKQLAIIVGVLIGSLAANAILIFSLNLLGASVRKKFRSQLRSLIYSKLQRLPYERLSNFVSGDLVSRMTRDLDELTVLLPLGIANVIKDILCVIGIIGVMFWMNWKLTLISGTMIPLFFLLFLGMMKTLEFRAKRNHEAKGRLQSSLLEKVEGNRDIQLTNSYDHQHQSASKIIQESETELTKFNVQEAKMGLVFALFPIVGSSILWGLGGYWTLTNRITVGEIVAFSYAFNYLFQPISSVFSTLSEIPNEVTALQRIFEIFPQTDTKKITHRNPLNGPIKGEIKLENISFGYEKNELLFEDLSLTIRPGSVNCIVGKNGIGKSTLFSLLLNLYQPNTGAIKIDGQLISNYSEDILRKHISFVPQQAFLFQGSIKDNIIMGRKVSQIDFDNACLLSGVYDLVKKFDLGIETLVTEKGNNLSGGEKQKIAIARALVENPKVLLLDEPTNNLDEAIKASIQQGVLLAKAGMTIILITHDMAFINGVTEIFELKNKKLIKKEVEHV